MRKARRPRGMRLAFLALALAFLPGALAAEPMESPMLGEGESWTASFDAPGERAYHCHPHPVMTAKVVVADDAPEGDVNVTISDYEFDPPVVRVRPGANVTWTNLDRDAHTVTFLGGHAHHAMPAAPLALVVGALALVAALAQRRLG